LLTGVSALLLCPACGEHVANAYFHANDDAVALRGLLSSPQPADLHSFMDFLAGEEPAAHLLELYEASESAGPVEEWLLSETRSVLLLGHAR
jgi:hypothetical protein